MLDELIEERRRKLARVRASADPYPASVARTETLAAARAALLAARHHACSVAGRVVSWRDQGKIIFADLDDGTGKLQVILDANELGAEAFSRLSQSVDVGDFL